MKNGNPIPSSSEIVKEAEKEIKKAGINQLHAKTFELIKRYREEYYKNKVDVLLNRENLFNIPKEIKLKIEKELLKPIKVEDIEYSNFMEETSRRISQTFQVLSGNIAELCVEKELIKIGLKIGIHYLRKIERTDFILYSPEKDMSKKKHRVEVKNVKLRERGIRGLAFDGDSMIGFFNEPSEFTISNIKVIDNHCKKTNGYCYVPPQTLKVIKHKTLRFKPNTEFAKDMKKFVETGSI